MRRWSLIRFTCQGRSCLRAPLFLFCAKYAQVCRLIGVYAADAIFLDSRFVTDDSPYG